VAVRVASAAVTATASSPPVGPMVGASAVAAAAVGIIAAPTGRNAVRDDFSVAVVACEGPPALERQRFGSAGRSAQVRLGPLLALRLVASLSRCLAGGGWLTLLSTRMK
jgi:hypothetical protein